MLFLRAIFLTIPRFIVILVAIIGLNHLDVAPLPDWTLVVASYAVHFLVTFIFAWWALRKVFPSWKQVGLVASIFLVFGVGWEVGLYAWMAQATWSEVLNGFSRESGILFVIYVLATFAAGALVRDRRVEAASSRADNV